MFTEPMRLVLLLAVLLLPGRSHAFAWMVSHGYGNCAQCHTDPSGGGLLTEYGRAQGEILLRTTWTERPEGWEPGEASELLFGLLDLPDSLALGGSSRSSTLMVDTPESEPITRFIQMQTDLRAQLTAGPVRASGTVGFAPTGAESAWITRN